MHACDQVLHTLLIFSHPFWATFYVIDAADTDAYVAAAAISQELPGILCIKRKQETVLCRSLVTDEMANCIVQLHCITGCDANSGFYGKGKSSVYDKVAKSSVARQ